MAARVRVVVWTYAARTALDEAIEDVAQDSPQAAIQVLEEALHAAASLTTLSERGRVVPELSDSTIREIFVFRYRLMYAAEANRVLIVAFIHGARDFATWRQNQETR